MALPCYYIYEPQFASRGWPDDNGGISALSWFDRDITDPTAGPHIFVNISVFHPPRVDYEVFPALHVNVSRIFPPRAFMLLQPTHILKNEVRRILMLKRET